MIVLNLKSGSTTASTPIDVEVTRVTNNDITVEENLITFNRAGYYEIEGVVKASSTASGAYGILIDNDGTTLGIAYTNTASASGENTIIPVYNLIKVESTNDEAKAKISLLPVGAPGISGGIISIKSIM